MNAAPIPKDTQDFQFKYASTQHVCDSLGQIPVACNLIVADGKRGLLYIAHECKLTVLKYTGETNNQCSIVYDLPYPISKLSISCDFSYLGVTFNKSTAYIYNANLLSKNSLEILHEVQLSSSSPNVFGYDLRWNPAVPGMFCTVASDHSIGCFQIKVDQKTTIRLVALEKIANLEAMCVAWSPKGKQLVIGCKNGNIIQLKPELKVARTIPGPSPAIGQVIAILWISNYQFCAAYSNIDERRVNVLIVNAPKGETIASFISYEDITYGMPDMEGEYLPRYYFDHIPEWNIIIAASSSSSEIAVLGSLDNGANWEQWQLIDSARAQLPLIRTIETYPVGITIDKSSTTKLPWGSENILPNSVPILHIFGNSGQIISFHMVNLQSNCPSICSPPSEPATIMPQPRMNMVPSEISINNHVGVTSTPRPKQTEVIAEKPKVSPSTNLFNNPASTNIISTAPAVVTTVQGISSVPAPAASKVPAELKIPKPRLEKVEVPPAQKPEQTRLSPVKEVPVNTSAPENLILNDNICWRAFQEELIHFEKELRMKLESQVWQVGTEDERQKLITQCAEIDEFWRELRETTNSLSSEIAYLKALLLQSFAWVEETKSRNSANDSEAPREHHDRSKIQELQRLATHTQSQLIQAMKALDMQWTEYQSQEKSKIKIPSLELIYQGLTKHLEIIARQKKIIAQQMAKLKALNTGNKISNLNRSIAKLNLNSNSPNSSSKSNVNNGIIETRCKIIANNTKNFTREKQLILRDMLLQNTPKVVKPIIPSPVQDRLEATLSSLASLNSGATLSKQKMKKLVPERPSAPIANLMVVSTTSNTSVQKTMTSSQCPLASLTSIVANIGIAKPEAATPPPQSKLQSATFSMDTFSSVFTNTSPGEKLDTSGNMQYNLKQNVSNQVPNLPPLTSTAQPPPVSTGFPKVTSISFGSIEQKVPESVAPANTTSKEISHKNIVPLKSKDNDSALHSAQPLFDTNAFSMSASSVSPVSKIDHPVTNQNQTPTSLGSNLTLPFKEFLPQVTTSQQTTFSFTSPLSTTATPKITATTTNNVTTESIQSFSFATKPISTPAFSATNPEHFSTVKSGTLGVLDSFKSPSTGLPSSKSPEKPPTSIITTSNSSEISFGQLSTPISSTINFGKSSLSTLSVTQPQQENKTPSNLPVGTTIEKVGGFASTQNPAVSSGSSIFAGNSAPTSNIFGTSIFGGSSMSAALPQITPSSTPAEKPTVTSTTSVFNTPINNIFSKNATVPSNAPLSPFNQSKEINFGKQSQASEVSSIFGKNSTTIVSSSAVTPSLPFAQTASSPLSAMNLTKSPSTTTVSSNFFVNSENSSTNSIFGGMGGVATTPPKLFGGSTTSPTVQSSPFNNAAPATGAPSSFSGSIFGGSATFGAQPSMPTAAAAPLFGAAPSFPAKPIFDSQSSVFGAAKPEFGNVFASSGFGNPASFGSAPNMTGALPSFGNIQMDKVFGNPSGSSTFESLAGQNNQLTFDSLAQKSPSPEKPASFTGGSSFSTWR